MTPTNDEISRAITLRNTSPESGVSLGQALSERLGVHWSILLEHSTVDAALYESRSNYEGFDGQHNNTEVAEFVAKQLNLKLDPITEVLRACLANGRGTAVPFCDHFAYRNSCLRMLERKGKRSFV